MYLQFRVCLRSLASRWFINKRKIKYFMKIWLVAAIQQQTCSLQVQAPYQWNCYYFDYCYNFRCLLYKLTIKSHVSSNYIETGFIPRVFRMKIELSIFCSCNCGSSICMIRLICFYFGIGSLLLSLLFHNFCWCYWDEAKSSSCTPLCKTAQNKWGLNFAAVNVLSKYIE